jgi:hypothetical protein
MNKKFLSTLLLSVAFVAATSMAALADINWLNPKVIPVKETKQPVSTEGIHDGIRDDRLDTHGTEWQRERPFDASKRDHGYYIEQNQGPTGTPGIHDGVEDDRMDEHDLTYDKTKSK